MDFLGKTKPISQWKREAGDLAARITGDEIQRRFFSQPFVIEMGTVGLEFSDGRLVGTLEAGKHTLDTLLRRWVSGPRTISVVVTDAGAFHVDLPVTGLVSSDNIGLELDLRLELTLDQPGDFVANTLKSRDRYTVSDLTGHIGREVHDALSAMTMRRSIQEMYASDSLRTEAEDLLLSRFAQSLGELGFALLAVRVTHIRSDQYDAIRRGRGETALGEWGADVEASRQAVRARMREILRKACKEDVASEADFQNATGQALHELKLKDTLRADEFERLSIRLREDIRDDLLDRSRVRARDEAEHAQELDARTRDHARQQELREVEARLAREQLEADAKVRRHRTLDETNRAEIQQAMSLQAQAIENKLAYQKAKAEGLAARIAAMEGASAKTLIGLEMGDRDALLELARLEHERHLTPEQLMIRAAEKSEPLAAALARKFEAEGKMNAELVNNLLDQVKRERDQRGTDQQMSRDHADRLERVMRESLKQMGEVAATRAAATPAAPTVITGAGVVPGVSSGTVIVNPAGSSGGAGATRPT